MRLRINWDQFRVKNKDARDAFEEMCYHLFCRHCKAENGVRADFNQAGLETDPIKYGKKWYGFQSKFFNSKFDYDQVRKSVEKAIDGRYKGRLNTIIIFANLAMKPSSNPAKSIEKLAANKKVTIEWYTRSKFTTSLNKPQNSDLTQLYFGVGDDLGFLESNVSRDKNNLIQSKYFLQLSVTDKEDQIIQIPSKLRQSTSNVYLLVGHPGSGKSVLLYSYFHVLAGMNEKTLTKQKEFLTSQKALPMHIQLKDCIAAGDLERLIQERKTKYQLGDSLQIIYLLDGLDEIPDNRVDLILSRIKSLAQEKTTKSILLSCRSNNANRFRLRDYIADLEEFSINKLQTKDVTSYFQKRGDSEKIAKLTEFEGEKLLNDVDDILLLVLLWQSIDHMDPNDPVVFLIEQKIRVILSDPNHCSELNTLNLLQPIKKRIIQLNKEISSSLYQANRLRISLHEIQQIAGNLFKKLTYAEINALVSFQAKSFFENHQHANDESFAYAHRRYHEYFAVKWIYEGYLKDATILRCESILSDTDLFEKCFLPYLRKANLNNKDISENLAYQLMQVYLGNHPGWGADEAIHFESDFLFPAIFNRKHTDSNLLLEDESLGLRTLFDLDRERISKLLKPRTEISKDDFYYLFDVWNDTRVNLLKAVHILMKSGVRKNLLIDDFEYVYDAFKSKEWESCIKRYSSEAKCYDRLWDYLYEFFGFELVITKQSLADYYSTSVSTKYKSENITIGIGRWNISTEERIFTAFVDACIDDHLNDLFNLLPNISLWEIHLFLNSLCMLDRVHLWLTDQNICKRLKDWYQSISWDNYPYFTSRVFFEFEILGSMTKPGEIYAKKRRQTIRDMRDIDRYLDRFNWEFALLSHVTDYFSFEELNKSISKSSDFRYYNELGLYAALCSGYIKCLKGKLSFKKLLVSYVRYEEYYIEGLDGRSLTFLKGKVFGAMLAGERIETGEKIKVLRQMLRHDARLARVAVGELSKRRPNDFILDNHLLENLLIDRSADELYSESVDWEFQKSIYWANLDFKKSREFFRQAMQQSVLRHGFRKDTLVPINLPKAFGIWLKNTLATNGEIEACFTHVFELLVLVQKYSERAGNGPDELIKTLCTYDVRLAEQKYSELSKIHIDSFTNESLTAILLEKVNAGHAIEEIESLENRYRFFYDRNGDEIPTTAIEKLKVWVTVVESDWYLEAERLDAFEKSIKIGASLGSVSSYDLRGSDIGFRYNKFCELRGEESKKLVLVDVEHDIDEEYGTKEFPVDRFLKVFSKTNTVQQVQRCFNYLTHSGRNNRCLNNTSFWNEIVAHLVVVDMAIELISLWKKCMYPHTTWWTHLSKSLHWSVAAALSNNETKLLAEDYLMENGGHGGFLNALKIYDILNDRNMIEKLFLRFLNMCELLVK